MTTAELRSIVTRNLSSVSEVIFTLDNGILLRLVECQIIPHIPEEGEARKPCTLVMSFAPVIPNKSVEEGTPIKPPPEPRPHKVAGKYNKKGSGW